MKALKRIFFMFCIAAISSHAALFAQEFSDYEKECNKIDSYLFSGDYDGGICYLKQKVAAYEISGALPDSNYSFFVMELAKMHYYNNDFRLAEKGMLQSLALDKKLKGEESNDYLASLGTLAFLYNEMGLYEKAGEFARETASIYDQKEIITDSMNYAFFLNNYGSHFMMTGNLSMAEKYFNQSKEINDLLFGEDHPEKATILHNLASMYEEMGEYDKAEKLYHEALPMYKKYYGEQHAFVATDLNSLATLYTTIGNLDKAEKQLLLAKAIYENIDDTKLGYIYVLVNLAEVSLRRGDLNQAESLCETGLSIADTLVARSHDVHISLMRHLAKIQLEKKEYQQALATLLESIQILKNTNPDHIDLVVCHRLMGFTYQAMHEYDLAEAQHKEALRIAGLHYDKSHKNYINSLNSLAEVLSKQGRKEEAEQCFVESMELFTGNIFQNFDFLSADEKQKYLATFQENIGRFNAFALEYYDQDARITGKIFDYNLFLKGLILTSSKKMKEFGLQDTANSGFRERYDEWINTKEYLANIFTLTKSEIEKRGINRDSIESRAITLEKELTRQSAVFAKQHNRKRHTWQEIQSTLKKDEVFVQIVRVANQDSIKYVALIVSGRKDEGLQMIVLDNGSYLENGQYDQYIENIYKGYQSLDSYDDTATYLNYWAKIEEVVKDKETVYLLPDGVYNKINIGAMLREDKQYVYEKHHLVSLNCVNDFMWHSEATASANTMAVLIGAPDYSIGQQNNLAMATNNSDGSKPTKLRAKSLSTLTMSAYELRYIDSLLTDLNWQTQLYIAESATEEMIKTVDNPGILHISTHGFFNGRYSIAEKNPGIRSVVNDFPTSINPLFCSGLYLAGAQNCINGESSLNDISQDGILTAYEVSNLNLDSTKLVVLSACETGLGEIIPGEGVFGLQRAFRFAGAENIIMTLWKVDDGATQLFMRKFYTHWLSGSTKSEAFDKSIRFLRFNTQDYQHPAYWAGFVLLGKEQVQDKPVGIWVFAASAIVLVLLVWVLKKNRSLTSRKFRLGK
jgi:CHAT domain-containing protein/Tfp pilus assembly protein PilF